MDISKNLICSAAYGKQAAILSDGTVVCSCHDKTEDMSLGSLYEKSFLEIWNGSGYMELLNKISNRQIPTRYCQWCHFLREEDALPARAKGPKKLIIEYNSDCMLKCPGCERDEIEISRNQIRMPEYLVDKILKELPQLPCLEKIGFFNHGEPLIYDEAFAFISKIKNVVPHIHIFTSTNGLTLGSERRLETLISSGIDTVLFSIDGSEEITYSKYRIGGNFAKAIGNMRRLVDLKKNLGVSKPFIIWRYILFKWNDSDEDIYRTISLASKIGVDKLCFLPTNYPDWGVSEKYSDGGRGTLIEPYLDNVF